MADTSNLSQYLKDVASAIKEKTGKTDKIPAANFDTEIRSIETGGSETGVKLFETIDEMQADTTAKAGDLAVVYESKTIPVSNGDIITSITFPKIVVFNEAITSEYHGMLNNDSEPRIFFDIRLNASMFMLRDMHGTLPSEINYSSEDGITYTRTDSNEDTYEIGETTVENLDEHICEFLQIRGFVFEGLYSYEGSRYKLAPTQLDATPEYVYNTLFYGKNGVEIGVLTNTVSNSFADTNAEIYTKILNAYDNMEPRVLTDTDKTIDRNIFIVPTKSDGVPLLDTSNVTNMSGMFQSCTNLTAIPQLDTSKVTNMNSMLRGCTSLTTIPLLNTSSVTNISSMFEGCTSLTTIPALDTSGVIYIFRMFYGCTNLATIPLLNTSSATNMSDMFYGCTNLTAIPQLDTSNVTNMNGTFDDCTSLTTIPQLDTSNVADMYNMFGDCTSLTDIPQLNTSNVTNMGHMFSGCTSLTDIPLLDTSKVTNMEYMFSNCGNLTTIPQLNTSNVTNMSGMFNNCGNLVTMPQLDTSKVTNMRNMFQGCTNLATIPLLDTSKVTNMEYMFSKCTNLTTIPQLDTSSVTYVSYMFKNCPNLTNESLNNILAMCANASAVTPAKKTLRAIGLTNEQATKCTTLSNYDVFTSAGWTTGY